MDVSDGANGIKGKHIKPIDCPMEGACPCDSFLRCSSRPPYGRGVWSRKKKREIARGAIAYDSKGPVSDVDMAKYQKEFQNIEMYSTRNYKNSFYKNIRRIRDKGNKVLTFPPMTMADINLNMSVLEGELFNTGAYTLFQKSIVLRANLVKNGVKLKSDVYENSDGTVYKSKKLTPYCINPLGTEWNLDHIQTRSKGACNRFCNAALLTRDDNIAKRDNWPGCPCVNFMGEGEKFDCKANGKLYKCALYMVNKGKDDVKTPAEPLGTIKKYTQLCNVDSPLKFEVNKYDKLLDVATDICQNGK